MSKRKNKKVFRVVECVVHYFSSKEKAFKYMSFYHNCEGYSLSVDLIDPDYPVDDYIVDSVHQFDDEAEKIHEELKNAKQS